MYEDTCIFKAIVAKIAAEMRRSGGLTMRTLTAQLPLLALLAGVLAATVSHEQPHPQPLSARNKELLYSRQTFAYGREAQRRLAAGSVTIVGSGESFR